MRRHSLLSLTIAAIFVVFSLLSPRAAHAQSTRFYATNDDNTVSVIDGSSNTVVATIPVSSDTSAPQKGVATNPVNNRVYVATSNGIDVIDPATNNIIDTIAIGDSNYIIAYFLTVSKDGSRLYVPYANNIAVIDTSSDTVLTHLSGFSNPGIIAENATGTQIYVPNYSGGGNGSVSVLETTGYTQVASIPVGTGPIGIAGTPDGTRMYVTNRNSNSVSVIDTATNSVIATIAVGSNPYGVVINSTGTRAYVVNSNSSGSVSVIDTSSNTVTATVSVGSNPSLLALSPDDSKLYVANEGANNLSVIDTATNSVDTPITVGNGPWDVAALIINNLPPTVGTISASPNPVQINTSLSASASFTDPDTTDTHTASWNWGDGNTTTGTVTESNGSGSVSNSHTYAATGVYTITLTVTDNHGSTGTSTYQYVAVYDSTTSFAGGHSFDNPSTASPNTSGKISFGISAKYNNSNVLTGNAKMNFKAANLDFVSTSLTSLATSNGKAYLKGTGTLNGTSGYTFLATGIDGSVAGGSDKIRFQIKDSSGNVVYDSQPGAGDTTDPTTTVATGNIRVH